MKTDKTIQLLNELREIQLKLLRSSANLDNIISRIEVDTYDKSEDQYLNYIFKNYGSYRKEYKDSLGDLDALEDIVWNSLLEER